MFEHERRARFSGVVPPEVLDAQVVTIIGCGAIGASVARILAVMGVGRIVLWDFDTVAPENLGTQGWKINQLRLPKVEALRDDIYDYNNGVRVDVFNRRWDAAGHVASTLTFLCVDTLTARDSILEDLAEYGVVIDTRMGAQTLMVISGDAGYVKSTLPAKGYEAPCTQRATYYCASIAAGLAVAQARPYLIGDEPQMRRFMMNLQYTDLVEMP